MPNHIQKRSFFVSNLNRNNNLGTINDIEITFPDGIFSSKIKTIELRHMYIDYEYETLGSSNNQFYIIYPENATPTLITINITDIVKTDDQLATLIANAINSTLGTTIFQVTHFPVSETENNVYRDTFSSISNYVIYTANNQNFDLSFHLRNSIGPLIGFGTTDYSNASSYTGGNIPSITLYESIYIRNAAFDSNKVYDNSSDIACKMNLYDSDNNLIENLINNRDTTISLPLADNYIDDVSTYIDLIDTELNSYNDKFTPTANFKTTFDYTTYKFTITNTTGAIFGIGFRFNNNGMNNYGSMHQQLGFEKKNYLGITSITSIKPATIFANAFYNDYILLCSDLVFDNYDVQFAILGSNVSYSFYDSLFIIPSSAIIDNSYIPTFKEDAIINIATSKFAKLYNENIDEAKTVVFYLKSTNGRHIKINTQWTITIDIGY